MNLSLYKKYYQIKQQVEYLNIFDRIFVLVCIIIVLLVLWFFVFLNPQLNTIKDTKKKILEIQQQTDDLAQKKGLLTTLSKDPKIIELMDRVKTLTQQINDLKKEYIFYKNKKSTPPEDLSKLLHAMLKETSDVVIDGFSTITAAPTATPGLIPPAPPETPAAGPGKTLTPEEQARALAAVTVRYKLVLKGNYFSIMYYLKKVEQLPWQVYWDKFNYTVANYPVGTATIEFYTLKPGSEMPVLQAGGPNG